MKLLHESLDEFRSSKANEGVGSFLKDKGVIKKNALDKHNDKFKADLIERFKSFHIGANQTKEENWKALVNLIQFIGEWIGTNGLKGKDAYIVKDGKTSAGGRAIIEIGKKSDWLSNHVSIEPKDGKLNVFIKSGDANDNKSFELKDRTKLFEMSIYIFKLINKMG